MIEPNVYIYLEQFWNNEDSIRLDYFETQIKT